MITSLVSVSQNMEIDIAALAEAVVGEKMKVPAIIEQGWSLVQLYA